MVVKVESSCDRCGTSLDGEWLHDHRVEIGYGHKGDLCRSCSKELRQLFQEFLKKTPPIVAEPVKKARKYYPFFGWIDHLIGPHSRESE